MWCTEHLFSPAALLDVLTLSGAGKGGRMALERGAAEHEHCITWQKRGSLWRESLTDHTFHIHLCVKNILLLLEAF